MPLPCVFVRTKHPFYGGCEIAGAFSLMAVPLAAALNMAIFLLIGKTSALTMNIAGVVKDWILIGLSVWLYK